MSGTGVRVKRSRLKVKPKNTVRDQVTSSILHANLNPVQSDIDLSFCRRSDNTVTLRIESETNGFRMIEASLSEEQFGRLVSGRNVAIKCSLYNTVPEHVNAVKTVESVMLPARKGGYRTRGQVRDALDVAGYSAWEMYQDGLSSQQNGDGHRCVVVRFKTEEN